MEKQAGVVSAESIGRAEVTRYEILPGHLKAVFRVLVTIGIGLVVLYMFGVTFGGQAMLSYSYYYLLLALFCSAGYLILPASRKNMQIRWYDLVAAALSFGLPFYFFFHAWEIMFVGWMPPTTLNFICGLILCLLALELARRTNPIYAAICLIIGTVPLYADHLPGILAGTGFSWQATIGHLAFSGEGMLGIPTRVMGRYVIAFVLFAGILIASGAGAFFLNLALALLGRFRGGPAKVAVVASGFFGSLSGSGLANVAATGSFTIPAMKRMGYPPHYAGAIEACASNGGVIMPPVMGAIAFIMAEMLDMPYATIMIAAAIPAIFYFFGLLIQVDAYAGKAGLKGFSREELPSLLTTLKKGWVFIFVLVFLVWGLVIMRWEALTPLYASGLMLLLSYASKETMMTPKRLLETITTAGKLITQTMAIIVPIGFIVAGMLISGASTSLTAGLIRMAGGNVFFILLMGVVICYILGMVGIVIPAYIFLAVTLAPAVIEAAGLNPLSVHLFIVYYAITAGLTPPVAVTAFFAATLAGASPMKTAFMTMRLAIVLYFAPFFFIFNPALILQGSIIEALYLFVLGLLGIFFIAEGLGGYLLKLGELRLLERPLLVIAGFLIAFPAGIGVFSWWIVTLIGAALALLTIVIIFSRKKLTQETRL